MEEGFRAMRYCIMGDSLAAGVGCPEGEKSWAALVAERFPQWDVVNLATGGESSRQALAKRERLAALEPDIVSFQYGMNDHYFLPDGRQNVPVEEFTRNLELLVGCVPRAAVLLVTNHPILEGDDGAYYFNRHPRALYPRGANALLEEYNAAVRAFARKKGIALVDMWAAASRYDPEDFLRSRRNTPLPEGNDGVHLHTLGNRVYADEIERRLRILAGQICK